MQSSNRFFDDLSKVVNGAVGTLAGVGREAEASARERLREFLGGVDFVSRDEFEAVKAVAIAAREEADALKARLDAIEAANSATARATDAMPTAYSGSSGDVAAS